jgi:ethanolamine ammonia-lyase small subunit
MKDRPVAVITPVTADPWRDLARFTSARIGSGRAGGSQPTAAQLAFQLAHARARDAVHHDLDIAALETRLHDIGLDTLRLSSAAPDRRTYIARPDLGRLLDPASEAVLAQHAASAPRPEMVFVIADGLSALAVERHAAPMLAAVVPALRREHWNIAPPCLVAQGRVAVADEVASALGAAMSVILIGERPGLSSPDSLGLYLTWQPRRGRSNAERNCISNVREPDGLPYASAAHKLLYLMRHARRLQLSGVALKEDASTLAGPGTALPDPCD